MLKFNAYLKEQNVRFSLKTMKVKHFLTVRDIKSPK